jgi:hypothetical protein
MSTGTTQSFASHARYVPGYHFLLTGILTVNLAFAVAQAWRHSAAPHAWLNLSLAIGLGLLMWYERAFPLAVQDRVIRLEETLRMERLLPPDLRLRIGELGYKQIVALRFASDAELPELVRRTLDERLAPKAIKALVRDWRPDHLRA